MYPSRLQGHQRTGVQLPFDRLDVYAAILGSLALLLVLLLRAEGVPLSTWGAAWPVALFAVVSIAVERQTISASARTQVSVAILPLVFVQVVFGPLAAAAVGALTVLPELPAIARLAGHHDSVDRPYLRWLVWTSERVVMGAAGGMAAQIVLHDNRPATIVLATGLAMTTSLAINCGLTYLTLRVRGSENAWEAVRAIAKVAAAGIPIYGAAIAFLAYAFLAVTPWTAALFFIPALAAHRLFVVTRKQEEALTSLEAANERLERANLSFATALVATLDARDRYTAGHSEAVAMYARDIAANLGWDASEQQVVDLCGLVHDIGKIGLPPGLLEKPGALTPEERRQMEEHSAIGERILANVEDYSEIAVIVRHHHERWDGGGYPDGLAGDQIPIISRILAVADAYDAMTSHRPYRAALPGAEARRRLRESSGSQFDPDVVDAFDAVLDRAKPHYLAGRGADEAVARGREERVVALAS
jgi:putative nucleotidyltransferase with HDIG domain